LLTDLFNLSKLVNSALITVTIMLNLVNKVVLILLDSIATYDRRLLCQV